jgi:hypothetical protein
MVDLHASFTGGGVGRKWFTEEVNHAIIARTAAEFQAFCRDLYIEASSFISSQVSDPALGSIMQLQFGFGMQLNKGNAQRASLGSPGRTSSNSSMRLATRSGQGDGYCSERTSSRRDWSEPMVTLERAITLGDTVSVPYGRKRLSGRVIDTLRTPSGRKFVVSIPIDDDDEMISSYDEETLARTA